MMTLDQRRVVISSAVVLAGIVLATFAARPVAAQDARTLFTQAVTAHQNGDAVVALRLLDRVESQVGPSPRVEGLRVHAHVARADVVNARIALTRYRRLAPSGSSTAHRQIIALQPYIDSSLAARQRTWSDSVSRARTAEADRIIARVYDTPTQREAIQRRATAEARASSLQRESEAFSRMINSGTIASAQEFYRGFPQSARRDTAYTLWQTRYLRAAATRSRDDAVNYLRGFRSTFGTAVSPSLRAEANRLYVLKWNEAKAALQAEYASNQARIASRTTKSWVQTLLTGAITGGAAALASPENAADYGAIGFTVGIGFSLMIDQPWNVADGDRRRNAAVWGRLAQYQGEPRLY